MTPFRAILKAATDEKQLIVQGLCDSGRILQLAQNSGWIPRYSLTRPGADKRSNAAPLHYDRLDQVFCTEDEADGFALQEAVRWIDENIQPAWVSE
jgi:hypothetical protein